MKNLKKVFIILFFSLILLGCDKHDLKKIVTVPTCTTKGYTMYICSCGYNYIDDYIDALGHSYGEWIQIKEATEIEDGLKEKTCSRCNDIIEEKVPQLSHTHIYSETIVDSTCEVQGYTLHLCICGDSYKDNYTNALGHKEEIIPGKKATCTEEGLTEGKKCSVCNAILVKQTKIKVKDHIESDWITDSNATCIQNGSKHKECSICNDILKTEIICSTGHKYNEVVINPTCVTTGYTIYNCTKCAYSYKDNYTNILGHKEEVLAGKEATCTEKGLSEGKKCTVCNTILVKQKETEALGHSYSEWKVVKEATETEKGLKEKLCCRCNDKIEKEILPKVEHDHVLNELVIVREASCKKTGIFRIVCSICNYYQEVEVPVDENNHIFTDWEINSNDITEETCTRKRECKDCGKVETEENYHDFTEWQTIKEPTDAQAGLLRRNCTICGRVEEFELPKHIHVFSDWYVDRPATATTEGLKVRICLECNFKEEEKIPVHVHNWTSWQIVNGKFYRKCKDCGQENWK